MVIHLMQESKTLEDEGNILKCPKNPMNALQSWTFFIWACGFLS